MTLKPSPTLAMLLCLLATGNALAADPTPASTAAPAPAADPRELPWRLIPNIPDAAEA